MLTYPHTSCDCILLPLFLLFVFDHLDFDLTPRFLPQSSQEGDLSPFITINPLPTCTDTQPSALPAPMPASDTAEVAGRRADMENRCRMCTPMSVIAGTCLPGSYLFQLSVTDSGGAAAAVLVKVVVEQRGDIKLGPISIPISADNGKVALAAAAALPKNASALATLARAAVYSLVPGGTPPLAPYVRGLSGLGWVVVDSIGSPVGAANTESGVNAGWGMRVMLVIQVRGGVLL